MGDIRDEMEQAYQEAIADPTVAAELDAAAKRFTAAMRIGALAERKRIIAKLRERASSLEAVLDGQTGVHPDLRLSRDARQYREGALDELVHLADELEAESQP